VVSRISQVGSHLGSHSCHGALRHSQALHVKESTNARAQISEIGKPCYIVVDEFICVSLERGKQGEQWQRRACPTWERERENEKNEG